MKFKGSRLDKNLLFFKIGIRMFLNGDKFYQIYNLQDSRSVDLSKLLI